MFYLGDFALLKVKRFFVDFFRDWWGEKIWRWLTNHGIARQGPHLTWKSHFQQQVGWGTRLWNRCRTGPDTGMSHQYNINWAWRQQQLKRVKKWQNDKGTIRRGEGGRGLSLGTPISLSSSSTSSSWSSSSSSCQHLHHHHQFSFPRSLHKRGVQLLQNFEIRSQGAYSENNAENIQQKRDGWVNK